VDCRETCLRKVNFKVALGKGKKVNVWIRFCVSKVYLLGIFYFMVLMFNTIYHVMYIFFCNSL
jgi:hypothetical protein